MDELDISGKRYISTRRAAREHGYHSDYMGQLIRGKKVVGQKVGRAWYIEEDSLNIYLGKALTPVSKPAPAVAPQAAPVSAPVEHLVIEEPAPAVAPEPQVVFEAVPQPVVPTPVEPILKEEAQPIAVRIEPQTFEPVHAQPFAQEIHHAPYIEEHERRIPIHIPAAAIQEMGGLRYAADDTPPIPVVTRIPAANPQAYTQSYSAPVEHSGKFPYISLSILGVIVVLATAFASNFISATVVSEQGKAATVQYAIHW